MTSNPSSEKVVLDVLSGKSFVAPPVWLMRQAGRYLPEYRQTRAQAGSFLDLCYTPKLATEVTLQPIRRFGFDASILFSDILVVPHALGQAVTFVEGEGPKLEPIRDGEAFAQLRDAENPGVLGHLAPVFEAVSLIRAALPRQTTLFGFCGAPWTVASYMINGGGSADQLPARTLAAMQPALVKDLIDRLVTVQARYLLRQFEAGADIVQIFESHAGMLPDATGVAGDALSEWSFTPIRRMIEGIRAERPEARIVVFARGSGLDGHARVLAETGADVVGVDWSIALDQLRRTLPAGAVTQGNLHPDILIAGGEALDRAVDEILEAVAGKPHIFNLGHGILPQTPVAHVEQMLARIRRG
ncbi:uroporphyrinogen decarboxylase [Methylobacterium organophilum]|nr:uroporphyrinogen decarboxylase [Methylobacterium organophilum]UMY20031.1 uroporphyrinogen decarboxylase [Methylobacterium organophilum]